MYIYLKQVKLHKWLNLFVFSFFYYVIIPKHPNSIVNANIYCITTSLTETGIFTYKLLHISGYQPEWWSEAESESGQSCVPGQRHLLVG